MIKYLRKILPMLGVMVGAGVFLPHLALANEVTTDISASQVFYLGVHLSDYTNTPSASNVAVLRVANLQQPCTSGVFLDSNVEKSMYSMLMAGVIAGKSLTLNYDTAVGSPWGNPAWCKLTYMTVKP